MKKYLITVNDKQYEVEVEEVKSSSAGAFQNLKSAPKMKSGVSPSQIKSSKSESSKSSASAAEGGHKVSAPMPGSVFKMLVSPGDEVKKGQTLLVFEAMKMENDLTSPADGTVRDINVSEGDAINVGDTLIVIE